MAIRTIQQLLDKFGPGDSPRSSDYIDLIETLADDRNAIYFSATAPEDTVANPAWFDSASDTLYLHNGTGWVEVGAGENAGQSSSILQYSSNQTLTNSTTKTTLFSYPITHLSGQSVYRVTGVGQYGNFSGSSSRLTLEVAFGNTVANSGQTGNLTSNASNYRAFMIDLLLFCNSSTSQSILTMAQLGASVNLGAWSSAGTIINFLGDAQLSENTATAKNLEISFTHSVASSQISIELSSIAIQKL